MAAFCIKTQTRLSSVRHLILAGEVFPKQAIPDLLWAFPNARLHNWYGPTETNVVTSYEVTRNDEQNPVPVPIGRPCPYAEVRLLRGDFTEAEEGERGMLHVAGSTLMNSYWGDPERTRTALHELSKGTWFYCTGDLARRGADGILHFLGRADDMVKVNGYRVEPAEVELALLGSPAVREVAIIAIARGGDTALVAVVVGNLSADELGRLCRQRLPAYMIPQQIVFVDQLPRNERGKVDKAKVLAMLNDRVERT
jgi:acyl-coenzyme A synthetase/AMP-(fatty) acid ligase